MTETAVATISLRVAGRGSVEMPVRSVVIAGFTGRDPAAVERHVSELAEHGVKAPDRVPAFYDVTPGLVTTNHEIEVDGDQTSGEVEPVLFLTRRGWFVGVGSDHTDRARERDDIAAAKAACPKVVGGSVVPYERVANAWDTLLLRSHIDDGEPYQEARLDELLPVERILDELRQRGADLDDAIVFLGTVPVRDGLRFSERFSGELVSPDGELLSYCMYRVRRRQR